jgi:aminopeptidase N
LQNCLCGPSWRAATASPFLKESHPVKFRAVLLSAVALTVFVSGCRSNPAGENIKQGVDTIDASLPTQLPRTAIPSHYAVEVTPHADALTFDGKVAIDLKVIKPTRELVLNALHLAISQATVTPAGSRPLAGKISLDADQQTATFAFDRELAPGTYRLDIVYSGTINTQANGLFALDYTNVDGKPARALFTQFEAADARRFVPSWDEPDYKATFDLTANVPADQMAVGNMPAASTKDAGNGLKAVTFRTTPVMSSYLLFFASGDFDRITKQVGDREVGVVTSRGNGEKARYALDAEAQILPYYNDYFGTPYPLPKLDNVAGPGQTQFFGAMENWGAIFTFERSLLVDPAITSEKRKHNVFGTEAHEMAHMWFGDLVTMAWWDDLWLNEGFASWMANKTTRHFHPDWGADVDQVAAREEAMDLDSFATTHPIVQSIRTVEQANQAFDDITYDKGESVISMLEGFAGPDVWRQGIRSYVAKFAYKNTRTGDLWAAVEGAGAKGLMAIARDFTTQPGIPLIQMGALRCVDGHTVAPVTMSQFSNDRRQQAAASPLTWHVPLRATAGTGAPSQVITQGRTATVNASGCGTLLINPGQTGYFRTLYTSEQAEALRGAFPNLQPVDQYGLLSDSLALSNAGYQPLGRALDLLSAVPTNAHGKVAEKAADSWVALFRRLDGNPTAQAAIRDAAAKTFWPRLQQLGFTPRDGEPPLDSLLRATLIADLGYLGEPHVLAESQRLFAAWQSDPKAIPGSLKDAWLGVAAQNADSRTWDALHRIASGTRGTIERSAYFQLLGRAKDDGLARRGLELAITKEPGATVSAAMIAAAAENHPVMAFDFVLTHLAQVRPLIDLSVGSAFVPDLVANSDDVSVIPRLEAYAAAHYKAGDRRPVDHAIARVRWKADNGPRIQREAVTWLQAHRA